ncbi:SGNH/GDSL hydrolase family protein [Nostocaceae cyanobacterium CENA357]|uniref:SGNH/GDSL hydrolase family protein n=1 Tax=Atlanticothrix silvestris CENA357 TaxID=1725252 RepID=A0A8J7L1H5_9CYAN|nr:SGNH/GDSL hydrolase family protein [Atlanticothrix silvestris]MBH8552489.1 SGNH/GDSL hydrolase family protein [Atlanticothrix silvestris CENA357]
MKKQLMAAGFVLFSFVLPLKAEAFTGLYVFGDSLSDNGNVFNFTNGLVNPNTAIPPSPPYFPGRFSNGSIWVDYFGNKLGLTPTLFTNIQSPTTIPNQGINYAIGGSSSGLGNTLVSDPLPGILAQVGLFRQSLLTNQKQADPNALYAIWGGANDYLFGQNVSDYSQIVSNLSNSVALLAEAGAKNIIVFNLPDLGKSPFAIASGSSNQLSDLTKSHNTELAKNLDQFNSIPDINIISVDVYSLFNKVVDNQEEFGFTNVNAPCIVGSFEDINSGNFTICNNPNDFLFFDAVHPTTGAHRLIADAALAAIPEPSAVLGMLALGALGAGSVLKRQQKKSNFTPINQVLAAQSSHTTVEN